MAGARAGRTYFNRRPIGNDYVRAVPPTSLDTFHRALTSQQSGRRRSDLPQSLKGLRGLVWKGDRGCGKSAGKRTGGVGSRRDGLGEAPRLPAEIEGAISMLVRCTFMTS